MALQRQEAFVSGLVPITGTATGAFQPIIGRVSSGITLDVSAVVSADRRYVQLTSWFDSSELVELKKTAFTGAAGGGGGGFGGGCGGKATTTTVHDQDHQDHHQDHQDTLRDQ